MDTGAFRRIPKGGEKVRYRTRHTLRQWRQLAGLTQDDLAEAVGRNRTTIVRWEQGKTHPTAEDIAKIEQALAVKWSDDVILPKA